jgi:hypothetical protein
VKHGDGGAANSGGTGTKGAGRKGGGNLRRHKHIQKGRSGAGAGKGRRRSGRGGKKGGRGRRKGAKGEKGRNKKDKKGAQGKSAKPAAGKGGKKESPTQILFQKSIMHSIRAEDPWIILSRQRTKEKVAEQRAVTQIQLRHTSMRQAGRLKYIVDDILMPFPLPYLSFSPAFGIAYIGFRLCS